MIILYYSTSYLYRFTTHDQLTHYTMLNIPRTCDQLDGQTRTFTSCMTIDNDHLNHTLSKYVLYTSHIKYFFAKTTFGRTCLLKEGACGGGAWWKLADLALYAVAVFENYPQIWSHPKQSQTGVSGYGLDWKRAFWAYFRENDHFHAQNWIYKFGHSTRFFWTSTTRN